MGLQHSYYGDEIDQNDQRRWSKNCTLFLNFIIMIIAGSMLGLVWDLHAMISNMDLSLQQGLQHANLTSIFNCFSLICNSI